MVARKSTEVRRITLRVPVDLARRLDRYLRDLRTPISQNSILIGILDQFLEADISPGELMTKKGKTKRS